MKTRPDDPVDNMEETIGDKMKNRLFAAASILICALLIIPSFLSLFGSVCAVDLAGSEQKQYYKNAASVMSLTPENVAFSTENVPELKDGNYSLSLDGVWKMTDKGKIAELVSDNGWDGAIDADVPGSIHTALYKAGKIKDPYEGDNMKTANKYGEKNWYLKRTFNYEGKGERVVLGFEGVCNVADFYLNGTKIGSHEGMFGGPYIDVTNVVKRGENTLVVHLKPAKDYTKTVVFNCSYGWHYAKLYPLGIWQSVSISDQPDVTADHPFITTADYKNGTVDLAVKLDSAKGAGIKGRLTVKVSPKNFEGRAAYFSADVSCGNGDSLRYRADIPDARLWWPNGYGEQNLYTLEVMFEGSDGSSYSSSQFGIRQLEYAPLPQGESPGAYNRQFVINGVKVFMKGAGWCTIDAMMRFTREDYDRILSRAHDACINYFRAWGGGLVETDEFYDLCDEYGICVYQEWPCCWDSTKTQPADVLYETVVLGAKRLRNRPSLVVWGGGNEGEAPYSDKVLNNMGKLTYETDGTRDFWRQDGGTGSSNIIHDHIWWSGASPEHYIKTYTDWANVNMSEYGLGAMMNRQSIEKFATESELSQWPIDRKNSISYHTATFNGYYGWMPTPYGYDIDAHMHYASLFTDADSLDEMITGSQLSQAQSDYPLAINARIKAPSSSVNVIYKLNDNYPGASWSIVDWYGAPKIAYYLMQDAYRPVMAAFKTTFYNTEEGKPLSLPVYVLDDTVTLAGKKTQVVMTAYDEKLNVVKTETFDGGVKASVNLFGTFGLSAEEADHTPLVITADLYTEGAFYNRTYMYFNYEKEQGSLFYLPRTALEYAVEGKTVRITNTGAVPAIGVNLQSTAEDRFVCSDNYFIITPGQTVTVEVNDPGLFSGVGSFNPADVSDKTAPTAPGNAAVSDISYDSAKISWSASSDDNGIFAYYVTVKDGSGKETESLVHRNKTSFVIIGLEELCEYTVTVCAADNNSNRSDPSAAVSFATSADLNAPALRSADVTDDGRIKVVFSTKMNAEKAADPARYILNNGASVTAAEPSEDGNAVYLTVDGMRDRVSYVLGVIGLTDAKKSGNNIGYAEIAVTRGLYLSLGFDPDANGSVYSGGKMSAPVTGVNGNASYAEGMEGKALSASSGCGAQINGVDFAFPENSTVTMFVKGRASDGFNVLIAKGPKASGHFEFYTRSGELYMYAPDIGDISLKYNINKSTDGWRQLAFVREKGKLTVYDAGRQVSSVPLNGRIAETTGTLSFGVLNDGSLAFAGLIDDVRIYESALSAEELGAGVETSEPYPEINGNETGKTLKTDFNLPEGSALNLWFCQDNVKDDFAILFAKDKKSSGKHFEVYTERGKLCFYAPAANGGNALALGADLNAYIGSWHMLTVIRRDGRLETYVDGTPVSTLPIDWNVEEGQATACFGALVEKNFTFPGSIAEYSFIGEAPDADRVKALYASKLVYPEKTGGLDFAEHILRLAPDGQAQLGVVAHGNTKYVLSAAGESAALDGETVRAVAPGETVIYARSDDGRYVSAALVVVEAPAEPEDTSAATGGESGSVPPESGAVTEKESVRKGSAALPILIGAVAAAAAAGAVLLIVKRRKNAE